MNTITAGKIRRICKCGNNFYIWKARLKEPGRGQFCSKKCQYKFADKTRVTALGKRNKGRNLIGRNPKYKGWRIQHNGYKLIRIPSHPNNNGGYVCEHRLVMEKHLGRFLKKGEIVHHKNHNRLDNRIENLELMANSTLHMKTEFIIARKHFATCKCKCHQDLISSVQNNASKSAYD